MMNFERNFYRGKRVDNGEWVEGFLIQKGGETFIARYPYFTGKVHETSWLEFCFGGFIAVDPETVGQYTGLTDKNGKKIFEGDILKIYEGSENDGYKICEVYSYKGVLCVDYETSEWDFNALAFLDSDNVFTFEVIGNIHDNPELLGGDD